MADNGDLRLIIQASIDTSTTAVNNLNIQIEQLSAKVKTLNLNVNVDSKNINDLARQIDLVQKQLAKQSLIPVFNTKDVKEQAITVVKDIDAAFSKYKDKGLITVPNKVFDPISKDLKEFTLQIQQADGVIQKLNFDIIKLADGENVTNAFKLSGVKEIDNTAQIREKALQSEQQLNQQISNTEEKRIQKETLVAQQLEHQVSLYKQQASINVQLAGNKYGGLVNSSELDSYLNKANSLQASTPNVRREMQNLSAEFKQIEANARTSSSALDITNKSAISLGNAMKTAAEKFGIWMVIGTGLMQTLHFFTEGIAYVNEFNATLTQIGTAVNYNVAKQQELAQSFQQLGASISASTKDVAAGALEFYRQGLGDDEVLKRLKTTTEYAKISGLDFKQSAELLTAATSSMKRDINSVSDVFTLLGDKTATSASEIGIAFQKLGGTAYSLSIPMEKAASYIAAISAQTREAPEAIGSAIKSIMSRVESLRAKGYDETDGTKVNQVAAALAAANVQLVDAQGQFRNFGTVLDELGAKWNTIDDRTKRYVATTVAGKTMCPAA
jgi:TP901 family phage tail tape measure protein